MRGNPNQRPAFMRLLPDLLLGLIAALGLAPFGIWIATPAALAVVLWRVSHATSHAVFWHMLAAGFGWFGLAMSWIVEPFLVEPDIFGWMAPFALFLMALGGAMFWALPAWLAARLARPGHGRVLAIASALVLSDWLRLWIFTGLPWAQIGHGWIGTPIAQHAAWAGAIGLSAMTMLLAALPTLLRRKARHGLAQFLTGALAAMAVAGGLWALGIARLAQPLPADSQTIVRVVQPDAQQALKWDPEWSQVFFQRLLDLSAEPGHRDLVIWPETAVNFLLNDAGPVLPIMTEAAQAPLIIGIQRQEGIRYFNSLVVLGQDGAVQTIYDKFHLVPFGEYVPWGDTLAQFGIGAFAAQQGFGYTAGPGPEILTLNNIPDFQPLICYEAIFPQHLRHRHGRPGWLLQATNDAWFGTFSGPYQHLAQAQLRSIESGLPMIRAANTGISAVIDARGGLRQSLDLGVIGKIDAAIPGALPPTFWIRWGDGPILFLVLLILGAACFPRRKYD